jgi:uncharacterized membrane protein YccC
MMNLVFSLSAALVAAFFSFFLLLIFWVIVMGFKGANDRGQLSRGMVILGYGFEVVGLVIDVWCNVLAMAVFLELTDLRKEPTVSQRLRRLVLTTGWRARLATWFAVELINPFAVGGPHIQLPTGEAKA